MRTSGYLNEAEVLNLCLTHPESPWCGSDPAKCSLDVVDRTEGGTSGGTWFLKQEGSKWWPAEFWFQNEYGDLAFLGHADWVETIIDDPDEPTELRCLSGDVYDAFRELSDHLRQIDWRC